jgi:predicted SprT family Zn-dependent metalloprotease
MRLQFLFICLGLTLVLTFYDREGSSSSHASLVQSNAATTRAIYEEVFRKPFDSEAIKAYMNVLPKAGDYFVVEGDLLMTEQELRAYIVDKSLGEKVAKPDSAELLVSTHNGKRDYYKELSQRSLTYAVDRQSFASVQQYNQVVANVKRAGSDWEAVCPACGVRFVYQPQFDSGPSHQQVNFIVRRFSDEGKYIAASFFPHDDPDRRYLNVDPQYFRSDLKPLAVGILRHELGHVLGYRHEHISDNAPGCAKEKKDENDHQWVALTPYDSKSVMHYFCGLNENGNQNPTMELSDSDRFGHRELYKVSAPQPAGAAFVISDGVKPQTLQVYQTVFEKPLDQDAVRAYLNILPRDGEYYVVEGDMLLTEQEVRSYVVTRSFASRPADPDSAELLVNVNNGALDYYKDPARRSLTYAVDRKSFASSEQYTLVVNSMQQAGTEWANACPKCGVRFVHQTAADADATTDKVNFVVRGHDASGRYVAAAFFPHDDASRRYLNIDPSYFQSDVQSQAVSVLRHQLGHVLGYRHQTTSGISGCYFEDNKWQELTNDNVKSVMHYFCSGDDAKRELGRPDREAHARLYGNYNNPSLLYQIQTLSGPELTIRFEGGDLKTNSAKVLSALTDLNLIPLETHRVIKGETLATIYENKLRFPYFSAAMGELADNLNKTQLTEKDLRPGQRIIVPNIDFTNYDYQLQLDPKSRKDTARLTQLHTDLPDLIRKEQADPSGLTTLTLNGYELTLKVNSYETLIKARSRLNELKLSPEHVVITGTDPSSANRRNLFFAQEAIPTPSESAEEFWSQSTTTNIGKVPENLQGDLLFYASVDRFAVDNYRAKLRPCTRGASCPDVLVVDQPMDRHPDIAENVIGGNETQGPKKLVTDDHLQVIEWGSYDPDQDHATYLAGIIGSRDNGFGLIGVDPNARITPLLWKSTTTFESEEGKKLVHDIAQRHNQGGLQIFVFASSWFYDQNFPPDIWTTQNPIARKIKNLGEFLWVVAAGDLPSGQGEEIHDNFRMGPMNLGGLPNVLVVTGYSLTADGKAHITREANYSANLVHIAAPAKDIVSTIRISKYMKSDGTSPATAFVAGVASAMASTWEYYNRADKVKFRLQLTATPFSDPADSKRLSSGILNPTLALYDPTKTWMQLIQEDYKEVTPTCWNLQSLNLRDPITDQPVGSISIDLIRRLYRVPNTNPTQWFIYEVKPDPDRGGDPMKGVVERIGPVRIAEEGQVLFQSASGGRLLRTIKDLILPEVIPFDSCPQ